MDAIVLMLFPPFYYLFFRFLYFLCSNNSGGPTRLQSVMQLQTVRSWELPIKNIGNEKTK